MNRKNAVPVQIKIDNDILTRALEYAQKSLNYTSRRNDFHSGGAEMASNYMRLGKIGEFAFEKYLIQNNINYIPDQTNYYEEDDYDFLINNKLIDVKTRTKPFHTKLLERVSKYTDKPKDIYISVEYIEDKDPHHAYILGFITDEILTTKNLPTQFHVKGEKNYFIEDNDLIDMDKLDLYI